MVTSGIYKLCTILIFGALIIFYTAYHHLGTINHGVLSYSELITSITSLFNSTASSNAPSFDAPGFYMHEDRAVLVFFIFSFLVSISALIIATWHRLFIEKNKLFWPIAFGSTAVCGCIVFVGYQLGLDMNA